MITIRDRNDVRQIPVGTRLQILEHPSPDYAQRAGTVLQRAWAANDLKLRVGPDTVVEIDVGEIGTVLSVSDGSFWITTAARERIHLQFEDPALRDTAPSDPGIGAYYDRKQHEKDDAHAALVAAKARGASREEIKRLQVTYAHTAYVGD